MRSDLERSLIDELGSVPPNFPVEDIENNVAPNAQILCSLSIGSLLLLSTGILWIDRAAISGKLKKVELIPFRDVRGCRISKTSGMYMVTIDRNDPQASSFGRMKLPQALRIANTNEHALRFQALLSDALNGSTAGVASQESALDKLGKLKALLDAGAISQDDYDAQKVHLLGQI